MDILNLSHPLELLSHPVDGRILEVLAGADASFTGRQIHALIGEGSVAGVQLGLARLRHQGIVLAEPAGRAVLYRLNADHLAAPQVRGLAHLRYELLRRLRAELDAWDPRPAAAYLFGSSARRDSTASSDVDIFLVRPEAVSDPDLPGWRSRVEALSRSVTAWTGNDARVVEFGESEVSDVRNDSLLRAVLDEGILLAGDESFLTRDALER